MIEKTLTREELVEGLEAARRRIAELESRQTEYEAGMLYRQVVEMCPDPVAIVQENGSHIYINEAYSKVFGYTIDDLKGGMKFINLIREEDQDAVILRFRDRLAGKVLPETMRIDLVASDGRNVNCEASSRRIEYKGQPALMVIIRDMTERFEVEKRLRESEEKYRQLFMTEKDTIIVVDAGTAQVLDVNPAAEKLYGYSREEFLKLTAPNISADPEATRARIGAISSGNLEEISLRYHKKRDGTVFPVEISPATFILKGRKVVCGIIRDITERKQNEEALLLSESKYRMLTEQASDGIFIADPKGNLIDASTRGCEMLGYSRDELLGLRVMDVITKRDQARNPIQFDKLRAGKTIVLERELLCKDGTAFKVEVSSKMLRDGRLQAIARDITDRKEAEAALHESERKYRTLVDQCPAAVLLTDTQGRHLAANEMASKMFGYEHEEFIRLELNDLVDESDPRLGPAIARRKKEGFFREEIDLKNKDSKVFPGEMIISTFTDRDGEDRLSVIISDITVRKEAEEKLRSVNANMLALIESTDDATMIADGRGCPVLWNKTYARTIKEALGIEMEKGLQPHKMLKDERAVAWWENIHRRVLSGESFREVYSHDFGKGGVRHFEISFNPIVEDGEMKGFSEFSRDITERKKAEEKLRNSESTMQTLLSATTDLAMIIDLDGIVLSLNDTALERFGKKEQEEILGKCIYDLLPPALAEARKSKGDEVIRSGKPVRFEDRREDLFFDNSVRPLLDSKGAITRLAIFSHDITMFKKTEDALRNSQKRYRAVMHEAGDAIVLADNKGKFIDANRKAEEITGYTREELLGIGLRELHSREELEKRIIPAFERGRSEGGARLHNVPLIRKEGSILSVDITGTTMRHGNQEMSIVVLRDITALKKAEKDSHNLAVLREREDINRWLHDHLGADLYNIILLVDGIQKKGLTSVALSQQMELVSETSRKALGIIRNYLDFSSGVESSAAGLVDYMEQYGRSLLGPLDLEINFHERGCLEKCRLQGVQAFNVYLIFKEGLTNIVKHARATSVDVRFDCSEDCFKMHIEDDGIGLGDGGAGLGQYGTTNIRARAEELGADISIVSESQGGTRVELKMPLNREERDNNNRES